MGTTSGAPWAVKYLAQRRFPLHAEILTEGLAQAEHGHSDPEEHLVHGGVEARRPGLEGIDSGSGPMLEALAPLFAECLLQERTTRLEDLPHGPRLRDRHDILRHGREPHSQRVCQRV